MNISDAGSNSSCNSCYNDTVMENCVSVILDIIVVLLDLPMNLYVIWLIVTGKGNGLAAEFFSLNHSVSEIIICIEALLNDFIYDDEISNTAVFFFDGLTSTCRPLFQCVMCVERYLAVLHPVTFLNYKPLRYRVICCVIVWVASFVSGGFNTIPSLSNATYFVCLFAQFFIFLFIQLFCLVAVLRALKQSGPGERKREKEENPMKRKAFHIILISTVTMLIMYVPYVSVIAVFSSGRGAESISSIGFACFTLAGLVQPVLFLYRMRKLPFIKYQ